MSCVKNSTVDCLLQEKIYNSDLFLLSCVDLGQKGVDLASRISRQRRFSTHIGANRFEMLSSLVF